MTENEKLSLNLSRKLLTLMLNENIPFERKKGKMDYLVRIGADVNAKVYGKSMALWAKELGDEEVIKYIKENGGVESQISKEEAEILGKQFWNERCGTKSIEEINELVLKGADLCVLNELMQQIWANLSVDEINRILKELPKGYMIDGDVNLWNKHLVELPNFEDVKVSGIFNCNNNRLITLKGAPREVGKGFCCNYNQLKDLKGAPQKVKGKFECNNNELETLKGAQVEVGTNFDCMFNYLKDLEGAPVRIGGHFICAGNKLTSLKGAPREIKGDFDCEYNKLETLEGAPLKVGGNFDCSNCLLTDLSGAPREVGGDFRCLNNKLTTLEGKPLEVGGEFEIEKEVLRRIKAKSFLDKMFKVNDGM